MNQKQLVLLLGTCVAVITIGVVMVSVFGIGISVLFIAFAILCPLSHLLMMRSMSGNHGSFKDEQDYSATKTINKSEEKSNVQNCH